MASRWLPTETKVWFKVDGAFGDGLFYCTEVQKNGGMKGVIVYTNDGSCQHRAVHTKHYSTGKLFDGDDKRWVKVPAEKVPESYKAALNA